MPITAPFSLPGGEMAAVTRSDKVLTITAHSTASTARCPPYGESSQRIYRYDMRRPRDLPRWEYAVCLVLHVYCFRCVNAACMTQTFTEWLPQIVRPVAQHTMRLTTVVQQLGVALGGERRVT